MKQPTARFLLIPKHDDIELRNSPELVYAEISGAFVFQIDSDVKKYKKFRISLEVKVKPKYFGIIKEKKGVKNYVYDKATVANSEKFNKSFRHKLLEFENNLENTYLHFQYTEPTAQEFKDYLISLYGRKERKPKQTFTVLNYYLNHIKELESRIGSGRKDEIKKTTINSYKNVIPSIKRYNEYLGKELTFEDINEKTYRDIWKVLDGIRIGEIKIPSYTLKPKSKLANGTIKTYQTCLIASWKAAVKDGISINLDLNDTNLINEATTDASKKTSAYLKESEILDVIKYTPSTAYQKLAKEYIIIACLTGMRLQSMREASNREIEFYSEDKTNFYYIHTYQEKTSSECLTPLFKVALDLLKTNKNKFPNFKDIKLLNLNDNIRRVLNEVGIENFKLFSTHNMRSSFATNLDKLGISEYFINLVTHPAKKNKSTSLHVYIKTNMLEKATIFTNEIIRINNQKAKIEKNSKLYTFS